MFIQSDTKDLFSFLTAYKSDENKVSFRQVIASKAFTLIELLVVVAVIGLLASVIFASMNDARESAYMAKAQMEFNSFRQALELYAQDHNQYPPDVNRGVPSGLEEYLTDEEWPEAPWPRSVFDWDNWTINGDKVLQISIRFCEDSGDIDTCYFPDEDWAEDFDEYSAVYLCIEGECRSHSSHPDSPGYCINCGEEEGD